jgi:hypothetical protein
MPLNREGDETGLRASRAGEARLFLKIIAHMIAQRHLARDGTAVGTHTGDIPTEGDDKRQKGVKG